MENLTKLIKQQGRRKHFNIVSADGIGGEASIVWKRTKYFFDLQCVIIGPAAAGPAGLAPVPMTGNPLILATVCVIIDNRIICSCAT